MTGRPAGRRALPHTADTRIAAWGSSVEECLAQVVLGAVETFVDISGARAAGHREVRVEPGEPVDQMIAVLDEVIYLLDVAGQVPVGATATRDETGLRVRLELADVAGLPQIGAVPKAVALHEAVFERRGDGWACEVTLDV
ncbi:archease [Thermopolyspora sp. NPDC052614]|uniref:archease n=1 Tax=Thermopolyspora sp. NPDC052614 TaxID=3155682 RepID=UPI00343C5433